MLHPSPGVGKAKVEPVQEAARVLYARPEAGAPNRQAGVIRVQEAARTLYARSGRAEIEICLATVVKAVIPLPAEQPARYWQQYGN